MTVCVRDHFCILSIKLELSGTGHLRGRGRGKGRNLYISYSMVLHIIRVALKNTSNEQDVQLCKTIK